MTVASIDNIPAEQLAGQPILVRIDADNRMKLRDSLPTLAFIADAGGRVVVATHRGLPPFAPPVDIVAAELSELLARKVGKLDEWKGEAGLRAVSHVGDGEIVLIENLAFEPGEAAGNDALADGLAQLAEVYCNDAFALSHQVRASTVGVAKRVKRAVAGLAFEREARMLQSLLDDAPQPMLALLAGELTAEKLLLAEDIGLRSQRALIAGQMVLPFLIVKGVIRNHPLAGDEILGIAERMMRHARDHHRILATPIDFTVAAEETLLRLSRDEAPAPPPSLLNVAENQLDDGQIICDIGIATRSIWSEWFAPARTLFWHGPVGISEIDLLCEGSRSLATVLASRTWPTSHRAVVCGSSLVAALQRIGFPTERLRHASHAGRAALHYFAGHPLPALEALHQVARPKLKPFAVLIPLNGSERDISSVTTAAEMVARNAEIILLHVRSGPDEEQYPEVALFLTEAEKAERRIASERIFARAGAILARHGLPAKRQLAVQGRPTEMILRYAKKTQAELIVLAARGTLPTLGARRVIDHADCATLIARPR